VCHFINLDDCYRKKNSELFQLAVTFESITLSVVQPAYTSEAVTLINMPLIFPLTRLTIVFTLVWEYTKYEVLNKNSGNLNNAQTTSEETMESITYGNKIFMVKFPEVFI
jgi:hypothetical protein